MNRRLVVVMSAVVFALLCNYMPLREGMANPNETVRFYLTHAIVAHHSLAIDAEIKQFGDTYDKARVGGRTYCDKAPMQSLLAAPLYLPLHLLSGGEVSFYTSLVYLRTLLNGSAGVVLFWLLFLACRRILDDERLALAVAFVGLFGTPLSTYFMVFFSHALAATLLFGLFAGVAWSGRDPSARRLFGLGLLAGVGVMTEFPLAVPVAILSAYQLLRLRRRWRIGLFLLGGGVLVLALALYNDAVFGSPLSMSYDHIANKDLAKEHARGLWGITLPSAKALRELLLSNRIGVLTLSPFVLLALPGALAALWRRRGDEIVAAVIALGHYLLIAGFSFWEGGSAFGARHLVPVLPFVIVLVARGLRTLGAWPARPALAGWVRGATLGVFFTLGALSVVTHGLFNAIDPYLGNNLKNPFADVLRVHLQEGVVPARSALQLLGLGAGVALALWLAGLLGVLLWVLARSLAARTRWALAAAALMGGLALHGRYYLRDAHDITDLRSTYSTLNRLQRTPASAAKAENLLRRYDRVVRLYATPR